MEPHSLSIDKVLAALGVSAERGLSASDAAARLAKHGSNELKAAEPVPGWRKFLGQFTDPLVILLLVATGISAGLWLHEREAALPYEAMVILSVVLLNATMGFLQEARAERAVLALRQMSAAQAQLVRDGVRVRVPAAEVVAGDVLLIEEGDTVPADARLIEAVSLQTAEATLTGESMPVQKDVGPVAEDAGLGDRQNMLFSGTSATYGHGTAVVVATGMQTQMGLIAGALADAPSGPTPLQKELTRVGKLLGLLVVLIAVLMIGTILLLEEVRGFSALFEVLMLGVALAVAAVPEGLPAVVTAVLSLGVQRMAKRNAIVRHLAAVEALGSANVIASDKTGTLTKNEMTVRVVLTASGGVRFAGTGYQPEGALSREGGGPLEGALRREFEFALTVADRANNAALEQHDNRWTVQGDPTEGALIVAAKKAGLERSALEARFERVAELPFSSERKLMSTVHKDATSGHAQLMLFSKGAPDVLLSRCVSELVGEQHRPLSEARRREIAQVNDTLAGEALRTLAVALRPLPDSSSPDEIDEQHEHDLVFVGLIGMIDPPRDEARVAVARARTAGIRAVMITGDHQATASAIARELGISADGRAATGAELAKLSDDELAELVQQVSVYARVNPEHKLRIVKALQRGGAIVAMTGDGVNDAPALKTADIGIAMGITGTDVSKEAADIVLADDNFASIVAAVEEGRAVFANIRKFLRYLLASNMGEVMTMFFGVVFADLLGMKTVHSGAVVLPVLATQLLWINLLTDGAPALALGIDPADEGAMNEPPRRNGERVITRTMWLGIMLVGAVTSVGTLLVFDASLEGGLIEGAGTLRHAQTMAFTTLVFFSVFTIFSSRSDQQSAFRGLFTNGWLWAAVGLSLSLQALVIYAPPLQVAFGTTGLSAADWLRCTGTASSVLWIRELTKLIFRALRRRNAPLGTVSLDAA